jgi:hypothetical protein
LGIDVVEIPGALLIFTFGYVRVAAAPAISVIVTVTEYVAAAVGVPEMTPVLALIERPAGKPLANHAYAGVPFTAVIVLVGYARPTVQSGNVAGPVTDGGELIFIE